MLEKMVREEVEKVVDPETFLTFGQMKMITGVREQKLGVVKVDFVPSSPFCPIAFKLAFDVKKAAENACMHEGSQKGSCLLPRTQHGRTDQQNGQQAVTSSRFPSKQVTTQNRINSVQHNNTIADNGKR